jgi:CBS domain-containing protein/sporulation protein YlmC with PRC-barrel domain
MGIFKNFNEISVHFSSCLNVKVSNESGKVIGKICDFFVDYEEIYPIIIAIQYKRNGRFFYIKWEDVLQFNYKNIVVKDSAEEGHSRTYPKISEKKVITSILANQFTEAIEYPPLGKVILDKQIVDTSGKKVVRVNDIQIIKVGQFLRVTHAEIGLRSMLRRLGYEKITDSIVKTFRPKSDYLTRQQLINWKYVHAIPNRNIHSNVKLNLTNDDIKNIHPADLADILEDLDSYGRGVIFSELDARTKAETLSEVDEDLQTSFIKDETPEEVAKIIEEMDTDDAADILHDLPESRAEKIISQIKDTEHKEELQELMEYKDDTAGGLMSSEFFEVRLEDTKESILNRIPQIHDDVETIYDLYVIDEKENLLGTLSLTELLIKGDKVIVKDIMNSTDIKSVEPEDSWKEVASYMSKYNLLTVPVLKEKEIIGIVSVDDVLPWLLNERS